MTDEILPIDRLETHIQRHVKASQEVLGLIKELSGFIVAHIESLSADEVGQLEAIVIKLDRQLTNIGESVGDIGGDIAELNRYYAGLLSSLTSNHV